ncbi:MAG: UbiX family flavin prenyltransferase [Magnetococcales bacterium]|nr:UbiX family flavin prenyltransferase [Magnetococcales bacterium]NGZ25543.1 UbiX family flavin prenyltransferase [Magnetococcales bacterium]
MADATNTTAVTVAITGASGAPYGLRLVEMLLAAGRRVDLVISRAGRLVLEQECHLMLPDSVPDANRILKEMWPHGTELLNLYGNNDWNSPLASGSARGRAMVICPCSMGTLAAVANGMSDNLLERAADVAIKEKWPLILVPREAPLSVIHLSNMLRLAQLGVTILPAAPGFYHCPASVNELIDFVVARILDHLAIGHTLVPPWSGGLAGGMMKESHQTMGSYGA